MAENKPYLRKPDSRNRLCITCQIGGDVMELVFPINAHQSTTVALCGMCRWYVWKAIDRAK